MYIYSTDLAEKYFEFHLGCGPGLSSPEMLSLSEGRTVIFPACPMAVPVCHMFVPQNTWLRTQLVW